ncbi:hypothetical protein EPO15_03855 [bacterium]|nr:MAG: hypothetical protein EPO15_03855 [bacterium]
MRARSFPLLLAAALSACGPAAVRVAYPAGDSPEDLAAAKALSQLYLVFSPEDGDNDLGTFAAALDEGLRARGGAVLAYRAAGPEADPFLAELAPSAVLSADLTLGPLERSDFEKEVKSKDKDGVETVRKDPFTRLTRRLSVSLRLTGPDGSGLGSRTVAAEESEEKSRAEAPKVGESSWMGRHGEKLMKEAAKRAAAALPAPRAVTRDRVLFVDKEDPASKDASAKAQDGAWEDASALWADRLAEGRGGWREVWNLGVAAEQRKAYAEAARLYRKAGAEASSDTAAAQVPFSEAAADASRGAALFARSESAAAFFARPTAVLPYSDDTTSVDGPANLRRLTAAALRRGGWAVADVEATDRLLRRHGYSQGGQLKRADPADLAAWTGAERLFFGDVSEFRNVMLGFLGRREVVGTLRLWDAGPGAEVYSVEKSAVTQDGTLDGADATGRLAGQLGKALFEAWSGKPLGAESALWVVRALQGLPLRPPTKR